MRLAQQRTVTARSSAHTQPATPYGRTLGVGGDSPPSPPTQLRLRVVYVKRVPPDRWTDSYDVP